MEDFRKEISSEAEDLVNNFFPKKCIEMDNFLKSDFFQLSNIDSIHKPLNLATEAANDGNGNGPEAKKRKLDQGDGMAAKIFAAGRGSDSPVQRRACSGGGAEDGGRWP